MNKLIIIGNGFDIHNGLATSYDDFIRWYLIEEVKNVLQAGDRFNAFFSIYSSYSTSAGFPDLDLTNDEYTEIIDKIFFEAKNDPISINFNFRGSNVTINKNSESEFFDAITNHLSEMYWVDIETTYYRLLRECLDTFRTDKYRFRIRINKLNDDLETLKEVLSEYLTSILPTAKYDYNLNYCAESEINVDLIADNSIIKKIDKSEFLDDSKRYIKPNLTTYLNFNYTKLTYEARDRNAQHINIHGSLNLSKNPPIFGYGDEIDTEYLEMEKTNENDFFTHIKSFGYFNNDSYSKLSRLLDLDTFIVYIWGHSCGLSDRTLLNMIFEHNNCAAIQPYYWRKNNWDDNYLEIAQNISRHFNNKKKLRSRLVNKEMCRPLGSQH